MTTEKPQPASPTLPAERLPALDILRGFALFGILMVNLQWFRTPGGRYSLDPHPWPGLLNRLVDDGLPMFFDAKFLSLFSALFGFGLAMQMERAEARGASFARLALRRQGVLLVLGVLHILLLWAGDILHVYAFIGLLSLLFLRRKTKTLLIVATAVLALPLVAFVVMLFVGFPSPDRSPEALAEVRAEIDASIRAYREGGFAEIYAARLADYVHSLRFLGLAVFLAFACFLTGVAAYKAGIVQRPSAHLPLLRKVLVGAGIFGLAVSVTGGLMRGHEIPSPQPYQGLVITLLPLGSVALMLAYGSGILLLLESPRGRAVLAPLAYAGRIALTNYLLQSVLCTFVFYGVGLGLYDRLGPAAGVLVVVGIYALEIVLSRIWLARFRFGPVEWLWRSLTYGRLQPMRG